MQIFLIRHAQTEANKYNIVQGQSDTKITEIGYNQARITSNYLAKYIFSDIYSSPLGRTMETSKLIAEAANYNLKKIIICHDLMEINLEPWYGKKVDELCNDESISGYNIYKNRPEQFMPLSGENFEDVQKRMVRVYNLILSANSDDSKIAIISHSVAIRTLLLYINNESIKKVWDYDINPSSITEIEYFNGKSNIKYIGFCPYLVK